MSPTPNPGLLGIYLNDHLAGAVVGANLARRLAASEAGSGDAATLQRLALDIGEDHDALVDLMKVLDVPIRQYKTWGAWIAERAGRLKLNGRLLTRSPLSRLLELEAIRLGVEGKAAGWRTLRSLADTDDRLDLGRLDELDARARKQIGLLEELRVSAAVAVFGGRSA
jgi:hypothetical protein